MLEGMAMKFVGFRKYFGGEFGVFRKSGRPLVHVVEPSLALVGHV